jgi:predicted negative regulator of RcsB-dependent stress response
LETFNPDDQLQVLRQWLRDNGPSLVAGLLLGALLVGGWTGWKQYTIRQSQQASMQYEQLRVALRSNETQRAEALARQLAEKYARTPYAALAALMLAGDQVRRSQFEAALGQYEWVRENARDRKLRKLAQLRRARLLWSLGRPEVALAELETRKPGALAPLFAELRGDILAGQGRREEAGQTYRDALAAKDLAPEQRAAIDIKLNDLNTAEQAAGTPVAPAAQ